jgi:hypothetical protein
MYKQREEKKERKTKRGQTYLYALLFSFHLGYGYPFPSVDCQGVGAIHLAEVDAVYSRASDDGRVRRLNVSSLRGILQEYSAAYENSSLGAI